MTTAHLPQTSKVSSAPLAIFVATQAEMKPIATALKTYYRPDSIVRVGGEGRDLLLARTGVGPDHAEAAARRLFEEAPIAAALSLGVAGGLSPQLRTGDLIVGNRVILRRNSPQPLHRETGSRLESFSCDSGLQDAAITVIRRWDSGHSLGPILTVDRIVRTAEEKRQLAVESGAIALDMESAAIASAASACSVPFLAIRGVLDTIYEDLAIGFDQFLDGRGNPQPLPLIRYLFTHPFTLPRLIGLGLRTKAVCTRLGLLLQELSTTLS
jgi:nucleoside phosphorylase